MKNIAIIPLALIVLTLLFACRYKGESLPNGFYLQQLNNDYKAIVKGTNKIEFVSGDITWCEVSGAIVYGELRAHKYADGFQSIPGPFVFNTNSGQCDYGLSQREAINKGWKPRS